jgi:hypothetical protein
VTSHERTHPRVWSSRLFRSSAISESATRPKRPLSRRRCRSAERLILCRLAVLCKIGPTDREEEPGYLRRSSRRVGFGFGLGIHTQAGKRNSP